MAAPRAQQVMKEQVLIRPARYEGYHRDLIAILNAAIKAVGDGANAPKRQRDIAEGIKAKASRMKSSEEEA